MNKKLSNFLVVLFSILYLIGLSILIVGAIYDTSNIAVAIIAGVMYLFVAAYFIKGYKIPHSNAFKYSLLAYAILLGIYYAALSRTSEAIEYIVKYDIIVCVALIAYMSGRLHKFDESLGIMLCVAVILLVNGVITIPENSTWYQYILPFSQLILWCCYSFSYIYRLEDHKKIGEEVKDDGSHL